METALFLEVDEFICGNMNHSNTFCIKVLRLKIFFVSLFRLSHHFFNLLFQLHLLSLDSLVQGLPAALNIAVYDHLTALIWIKGLADGALRDVIRLLLTIFKLVL